MTKNCKLINMINFDVIFQLFLVHKTQTITFVIDYLGLIMLYPISKNYDSGLGSTRGPRLCFVSKRALWRFSDSWSIISLITAQSFWARYITNAPITFTADYVWDLQERLLIVSPAIEIRPQVWFYDYYAKYGNIVKDAYFWPKPLCTAVSSFKNFKVKIDWGT